MSEQNMTEHRHFGRYLRRIREDRKLSLDAVEEMTGGYPEPVTKSHLSRIENGRAVPTFPRMFALCQVYGVPISSMAERFETDLRRGECATVSLDPTDPDGLLRQLDFHRHEGRYDRVLRVTTAAIEQLTSQANGRSIELRRRLITWQIGAMIKLGHLESGKLKCEELISESKPDSEFHLRGLVSFVICSYRLGRLAVALMGLAQVEKMLELREWPADLRAIAHSTRGSVYYKAGDLQLARSGFESAHTCFDQMGNDTETCRAKLNLAQVLIDRKQLGAAERYLKDALRQAEAKNFRRQMAVGYGHLAVLYYTTERFENSESVALKSNKYAREIDHQQVVFRNCYYLWRIALKQGDRAAVAANERNLRTLVDRVPGDLPEVDLYRRERGDR